MSAAAFQLATGPVTWGVDFADAPENPPWERVLDEITASSLDALELGPIGYLPEDPDLLQEALQTRALRAVGSFVFDDLHDPAQRERVLGATERAARLIASVRGAVLVIIDRPGAERAPTAGRSEVAPRLGGSRWSAMMSLVEEMATLAREHGLRPVIHPHAGGFIEFDDEIARLVDSTDLDLCLDTGHLAYAGIDPGPALLQYRDRLGHVHLKDVRGDVLGRVRRDAMSFWQAVDAEIFCPLGEGVVDVSAVVGALEDIGYDGAVTIEQDRVPGRGTPLSDLAASVAVVERALGHDHG